MVTIDPHDGSVVDDQVAAFHDALMTALTDVLERTSKMIDPHGPVHSSNIMRTFWKSKVDGLVDKLEAVVISAADRTRTQLQSHVDATAPVAVNHGGDLLRAQLKAAGRRSYVKTSRTAAGFVIPSPVELFAEIYLRSRRGFLLDLGTDAWNMVRGELLAGMNNGEGIGELRSRVMSVADVAQPRAERIARTEVVGATNAGAIEQVRASKLDATKTWLATNDNRTRQSHADVDGTTVPLNDTFLVGGVLMDRPHDPTAPPDEVIQCRCTLTFEIPDDAVTAAAFGNPDQPRDYHGRWGHGGVSGDLALTGQDAYNHVVEKQGDVTDSAQRRALDGYFGDSSGLNSKLRTQKSAASTDKRAIAIKQAIDQHGALTDQPILVHRAVSSAETVFGTKDMKSLVGAQVKDHAFVSTSTERNLAEWFVGGDDGAIFNITVPAHTKVLAMDAARGMKHNTESERELLLDTGTAWKITKVERDETQGWNIDAEVV